MWLYSRFSLSFRDIEAMMAKRGITVSYETVREWCSKFGGAYAKADALSQLASRRPTAYPTRQSLRQPLADRL